MDLKVDRNYLLKFILDAVSLVVGKWDRSLLAIVSNKLTGEFAVAIQETNLRSSLNSGSANSFAEHRGHTVLARIQLR